MTSITNAMQALLQFAGVQPSLFAANSRYTGIATGTFTGADGRPVTYIRRRIIPQPQQLAQVQQHTVTQGERLDVIAAQYLGDPELFWRICDGNGAMRSDELTAEVGRVLRITLAQGVPGTPNA
jgi:hypothetical protein